MTYRPIDVALFAISEFERGLEGLTDDEARLRLTQADGSEMNAISWTAAHIAGHWLMRPAHLERFGFGAADPTPPSLEEARTWLAEARAFTERWLRPANDPVMARVPDGTGGETIGTAIMRASLHTWFHIGEINAVRQMLGHAEIPFVGPMLGNLEWHPAATG